MGFETALQLARRGAKVYLGCRSEARAKDAIARMRNASPGVDLEKRLVWLPLDLSVMRLAKQAGEELLAKETRLDILSEFSPLLCRVQHSIANVSGILFSQQSIMLRSLRETTNCPKMVSR